MKLPRPSDTEIADDDNSCDALRDVKDQHTSHWDMDMLSREQLDKLAAVSRQKHRSHSLLRVAIFAGIGLAISLVVTIAVVALRG